MNKDLYGKKFSVPEEVVRYLEQCHGAAQGASETTEGYRRNIDLREKKEVSYQQLKRMKNWFDNFNGDENDLSYILNGGNYVKNWVDRTLESMRNNIYNTKKNKSEVLPDQFNKKSDKIDLSSMNRPSKSHNRTVDNYNIKVTESLKRINEIIKKLI